MGGAPSIERVYSDSASPETVSGDDDRWPSAEYFTMAAPWHFTDDEYGGQPCEAGAPLDGGCPVRQVQIDSCSSPAAHPIRETSCAEIFL